MPCCCPLHILPETSPDLAKKKEPTNFRHALHDRLSFGFVVPLCQTCPLATQGLHVRLIPCESQQKPDMLHREPKFPSQHRSGPRPLLTKHAQGSSQDLCTSALRQRSQTLTGLSTSISDPSHSLQACDVGAKNQSTDKSFV